MKRSERAIAHRRDRRALTSDDDLVETDGLDLLVVDVLLELELAVVHLVLGRRLADVQLDGRAVEHADVGGLDLVVAAEEDQARRVLVGVLLGRLVVQHAHDPQRVAQLQHYVASWPRLCNKNVGCSAEINVCLCPAEQLVRNFQ